MKTNTQVEEMVGAWTNLQKQFWGNYMPNNSKSKKSEWEDACKRPLELTRDMLSETLKTQAMLARDSLRLTDSKLIEPSKVDEFYNALQEMVDSGINSEEEILESWFTFAKEFEQQLPASTMYQWNTLPYMTPTLSWNRAINSMMKAWENAAEKTLEVQNDFISQMIPEGKPVVKKERSSTVSKTSDSHKKAA